jgi:outer membrane protein
MRKFMAPAAALLAAGLLSAQQPPAQPQQPAGPALTLKQATALAIQNHPQVSAARNIAAEAGQHITESKASYYPTLDGVVTGSQANNLARLGAGALPASALFNRNGEGLQLSELLADFGRRKNLVASSQFQAQAADQNTQATIYDVVLGVNRGYFGVLQAQAYVNVATETVKARQSLSDQVTALANASLKSEYDVGAANVNLSEAKLMVIRAQDAVERAYADLARALGVDQVTHYNLAAIPAPAAPVGSPEPLIQEAMANRPELKGLQLQLQGAQAFEQAEADLKKPTLSLLAVGGALPYINQDPRTAPYGYEGVGINLDIPIFNGHLFSARQEAAHYDALAVSDRVRNLRQQVANDVRDAWISASTAYQRIPVTEQLLKQANLTVQLAQGRYNLGLATIVDITQAQLNLTEAQIENVTATYDYQSAYAQLQYTTGALR